eukprot:TRINITY_DN38337_c0_g1_i1.p1 TRINITY_DN38337_c0_g1~~TRINITY_DN38337_c0_g1_i1.p1  ORF type:complete len:211 (+),score=47.83 TRINITY_DN38337_c0_g1_i1:159-791(+)
MKYLGFFREAVVRGIVYVYSIYDWAKSSSGPLRPGVDKVEGLVKAIVGPVYSKLEGKPDEFLQFVDAKVDSVLITLDSYIPTFVKHRSSQGYTFARNAPDHAKLVAGKIKEKGVTVTAKDYFDQYSPVVKDYGYYGWKQLLALPLVPQIVKAVTPSAAHIGATYNSFADYAVANETLKPVGAYLPKVPVEDIVKTVKADTDAALKVKKAE